MGSSQALCQEVHPPTSRINAKPPDQLAVRRLGPPGSGSDGHVVAPLHHEKRPTWRQAGRAVSDTFDLRRSRYARGDRPHKRTYAQTAAYVDQVRKTERWFDLCDRIRQYHEACNTPVETGEDPQLGDLANGWPRTRVEPTTARTRPASRRRAP